MARMIQAACSGRLFWHARYGLVRCVADRGDLVDLELFISPTTRRQIVASRADAIPYRLQEQTRVYVESGGECRAGRIIASDRNSNGYEYIVQFPNEACGTVTEQQLHVRCNLPHDDPTSALALGGMETQFWHDHRLRFGASLAAQRAACRGLRGIISSRVELVPHQVDLARRVLEDHIQRYLLADEVGMGKTIEAGFVVRHILLTENAGEVWITAPTSLLPQWRTELREKFCLDQFGERVRLFAFDEVRGMTGTPALLVVDEAHHLVARELPPWLETMARDVDRILLLSATPSLRDPTILLRLLRLIDPLAYADVPLEEFRARLARQDEIGVFIRGLRADALPLLLRQRARRLPELFPGDAEASGLGDRIVNALETGDGGALGAAVGALRSHVADVYRTHQRLVRSRRRDCEDWFLPRGPAPSEGAEVNCEHVSRVRLVDPRLQRCFEPFEEWRIECASRHPPDSADRDAAREVFRLLFEAWGCGADAFAEQVARTPQRWMAPEWKSHFLTVVAPSDDDGAPLEKRLASELKHVLQAIGRRNVRRCPKLVVFGEHDAALDACADALRLMMGRRGILDAREIPTSEDAATAFRDNAGALVLLCGRVHEEGLNLQFADAVVHLDLPLSPQRIEQRIGRLDRFGRTEMEVSEHIVLRGPGGERDPWEAYCDVLAYGFRIYNEPIADLQFILDDATAFVCDALFEQGAEGARALIPALRERLTRERDALDNQYALDRVLQQEDEARAFVDELDELECNDEQIAASAQGWLSACLQLHVVRSAKSVVAYRWSERTLLPTRPWRKTFEPGLDVPQTARRRTALAAPVDDRPQLLRIGGPLLDAAATEYDWDDRGTAFATWRVVGDAALDGFLAFKLCYFVEARLPQGLTPAERGGLSAQLDGLLPPRYEILFVDPDLLRIEDQEILRLLKEPYRSRDTGGSDYNLGSRQHALYAHIDALRFERLCRRAREESEQLVRADPFFTAAVAGAVERGRHQIELRLRRVRQRLALKTEERHRLEREIDVHQQVLLTLDDPRVTLDAIGAIVLSREAPPDEIRV